jgi:transglutaminase-like putative cysteine protease
MIPVSLGNLQWTIEDIGTPEAQRKRLWDFILQWTGHPLLVDWAAKLIKKYKVPERNDRALVQAVLSYSQDHIKFFRERPERFSSPLRTIQMGLGDCDDKSIFIATILRTFRIPVRLVFLRFKSAENGQFVSHVYPQAKIDGQWISLESVHKWDMGDDPITKLNSKNITNDVNYIGDN